MPELLGMDTHTTSRRSPASTWTSLIAGSAARGALLLSTVAALAWTPWAGAQTLGGLHRRTVDARHHARCGGDALDGACPASCSGDPLDGSYDADCFSCDLFTPPEPKPACAVPDEPCEIHEGINRLGALVESGVYDDRILREVALAYWDSEAWDLSTNWGGSALDGYVAYSVVRAGLEFRQELARHPTTRLAMECALRDHAGRGIPVTAHNGTRRFHGPRSSWNTWSEDYMGFALGYAAADAWLRTSSTTAGYFDEYYELVREAVDAAFSVTEDGMPETLTQDHDGDPADHGPGPTLMLRNHGENSPVYATVILKHLTDVNSLYRAAGLPPYFTCDSKPATYDELYRWVLGKIEPNPEGAGFVFRSGACQREDGSLSSCDDRPGDPPGSGGHRREPGHYPLARTLPDLCIAEGLEFFSASCGWYGPAEIEQAPHNYYFNCVFPEEVGTWAQLAETEDGAF
jgi:hypothetical protein